MRGAYRTFLTQHNREGIVAFCASAHPAGGFYRIGNSRNILYDKKAADAQLNEQQRLLIIVLQFFQGHELVQMVSQLNRSRHNKICHCLHHNSLSEVSLQFGS